MKSKIKDMADTINEYCIKYDYFWASGLVKETINLWKLLNNYELLNETAQIFADHYLEL